MGEFCLADEFILETQGLTKEFAGFFAVRDVALKVRRGSIHALIGPNGAGKTTCFNLLTHFLEPTSGSIFYKGRDITGSPPARIARMGLARSFQISAVVPHLTVLQNLRLPPQGKRGHSFDLLRSSPKATTPPFPKIRRWSRPTWAPAMADLLLAVKGLNAWYGESHILHGMEFEVREGEVVTLLGRNGAGKTTTLKSIMGMVGRREGSIVFRNTQLANLSSNRIARLGIAFCPEERGIFASLD